MPQPSFLVSCPKLFNLKKAVTQSKKTFEALIKKRLATTLSKTSLLSLMHLKTHWLSCQHHIDEVFQKQATKDNKYNKDKKDKDMTAYHKIAFVLPSVISNNIAPGNPVNQNALYSQPPSRFEPRKNIRTQRHFGLLNTHNNQDLRQAFRQPTALLSANKATFSDEESSELVHESGQNSTVPENLEIGYQYMSGTSMATPHVTAVIADMLSINPNLNTEQIRCLLTQSALPGKKLDHLHAMMKAEESLTKPVVCPPKTEKPRIDESRFVSENNFEPQKQIFKGAQQARSAAQALSQSHPIMAQAVGKELSLVPKQVMFELNSAMAKKDLESISKQLNQDLQKKSGNHCTAKITVTGRLSPTVFIANVAVDPSKHIPTEGAQAIKAQTLAMQSVCHTLPECEGIGHMESDYIFPFHSIPQDNGQFISQSKLNEQKPGLRDEHRPKQWSLNNQLDHGIGTDAAKAYRRIKGFRTPMEAGITIGVGDTGGSIHPDMDKVFLPGWRFDQSRFPKNDSLDRSLRSSHGAHVAGTIAAITGNMIGTEGVTEAKILPAKVLSDMGSGSLIDIILGIRWMAGLEIDGHLKTNTPARVINLSLGYNDKCSKFLQDTISEAAEKGVIIVVAAGNSATDARFACPSNCQDVISVGASNEVGSRASFSNYGDKIDIYAPGDNIFAPTHRWQIKPVVSTPPSPPNNSTKTDEENPVT